MSPLFKIIRTNIKTIHHTIRSSYLIPLRIVSFWVFVCPMLFKRRSQSKTQKRSNQWRCRYLTLLLSRGFLLSLCLEPLFGRCFFRPHHRISVCFLNFANIFLFYLGIFLNLNSFIFYLNHSLYHTRSPFWINVSSFLFIFDTFLDVILGRWSIFWSWINYRLNGLLFFLLGFYYWKCILVLRSFWKIKLFGPIFILIL